MAWSRPLLTSIGAAVHVLRDPTRGGVATTLKEIALQSRVDIVLDETAQPIHSSVRSACAILGLDPLFVANEGKMLAVVAADQAESASADHAQPPPRSGKRLSSVKSAQPLSAGWPCGPPWAV